MKKFSLNAVSLTLLAVLALIPIYTVADESLVRFEGGIGVIPVSAVAGVQNANGTFPDVSRNDVRRVPPGGQPWVIARLSADVTLDGRISVDGQGLLLAGGNGIGTRGGINMVLATLFCGPVATQTVHSSDAIPLGTDGDFRIDDILSPAPPASVVPRYSSSGAAQVEWPGTGSPLASRRLISSHPGSSASGIGVTDTRR